MATQQQISRQRRALVLAQSRFERWSQAKTREDVSKILGIPIEDVPADVTKIIEKAANRASIEVTNLKTKLQGVAQ